MNPETEPRQSLAPPDDRRAAPRRSCSGGLSSTTGSTRTTSRSSSITWHGWRRVPTSTSWSSEAVARAPSVPATPSRRSGRAWRSEPSRSSSIDSRTWPVRPSLRSRAAIYGGATDLALCCDLRIGVSTSRMFMPAARFGLHYYADGLRRYVSRLGPTAARKLMLTGCTIEADEMLRIGFLTDLVDASGTGRHRGPIRRAAACRRPGRDSRDEAKPESAGPGRFRYPRLPPRPLPGIVAVGSPAAAPGRSAFHAAMTMRQSGMFKATLEATRSRRLIPALLACAVSTATPGALVVGWLAAAGSAAVAARRAHRLRQLAVVRRRPGSGW